MEIEDYLLIHLGEGVFQAKMDDGTTKNVGPSLCGIIRYTYFEDYSLPKIGWKITRSQLMGDYIPKMHEDVLKGNIKPKTILVHDN